MRIGGARHEAALAMGATFDKMAMSFAEIIG
jgi:hypothetical protein